MPKIVHHEPGIPWPLYHPASAVAHFPIYKNAHSALTDWLKGKPQLFQRWPKPIPDQAHSFAVIRHPYDRYISALAQIYRGGQVVPDIGWDEYIRGVEKWNLRMATPWTAQGNYHFRPQTDVIERMPADRTYFPIHKLGELRGWLHNQGIPTVSSMDHQKKTAAHQIEYARRILTPWPIEHHYSSDLTLWEKHGG